METLKLTKLFEASISLSASRGSIKHKRPAKAGRASNFVSTKHQISESQ
jgi:hypothetical protein